MTAAPSGLVTLTTDFGHEGPFVGVMKGCVLARFPAARIIDLTHEIPVHRPAEAGFWLARAHGYFPPGTVHVAVVDPGVGTARAILAVEAGGHRFLAPDNGLLAPVLSRAGAARIVRVGAAGMALLGGKAVSATFHGRDIFAPLAAELASGRVAVADLGETVPSLPPASIGEPRVTAHGVSGAVVTIDRFGNLITDIDGRLLARFTRPGVHVGGLVLGLGRTYGDGPAGTYLALVNSFGVLEVARVEGSAAAGLGLGRDAPIAVREQDPS